MPTSILVQFRIGALAVMLLSAQGAYAMAMWPTNWQPLNGASGFYADAGDQTPAPIDLVGGNDGAGDFSAGYVSISPGDDQISLRMRLDANGSGTNSVWHFLLETDGDPMTADWAIVVRQGGNPAQRQVLFAPATTGGPTFNDIVLAAAPAWTGTLSDWSRWGATGDGSNFDGNPDAYLDVAMPLVIFQAFTGLGVNDPFRVALLTSTSHTQINKDVPMGLGINSLVSGGWAQPVPEPSSGCLAGLGLLMLGLRARSRRR